MNNPSPNSFIERRTVDLVPGHTLPVNIYGKVFACTMSTGAFEMNFNDGAFFPVPGSGVRWSLIGEDRFSRLAFRAAIGTTLEFYAGNFFWEENTVIIIPPTSKVAQTIIKPGPILIGAGLTVALPGTAATGAGAGLDYRKYVNITNLDAALDLEVINGTNPAANPVATVFARQANVFETSDDLILKNTNPSDLVIRVMEVFYPEE